MIFFTADTHFGHNKIIKYCNRPFSDANDMDRSMIINWNNRVSKNDTVYVLGDFSFNKKGKEISDLLKSLNGEKHLIIGNHDGKEIKSCEEWKSVNRDLITSINGTHVHMYHYPLFSWDKAIYGSFMLHGHCHNGLRKYSSYKSVNWNKLRMIDVGVDAWGYRPVSFYEIKDMIDKTTIDKVVIDWENADNNIPDAECIDNTLYWVSVNGMSKIGLYCRKDQSFEVLDKSNTNTLSIKINFNYEDEFSGMTVTPLQELEKVNIILEKNEIKSYLIEAEKRYQSNNYSELVYAFNYLINNNYLKEYKSFVDEDNAKRFMSIVKLDIKDENVIKYCSKWASMELNIKHAEKWIRHGLIVSEKFFKGNNEFYNSFVKRNAVKGIF